MPQCIPCRGSGAIEHIRANGELCVSTLEQERFSVGAFFSSPTSRTRRTRHVHCFCSGLEMPAVDPSLS